MTKVPQAMGPVYLAGAFSENMCDVRLYNEQYSGPLKDEQLLSWPDMLVLTGLTNAFDRMLHLTAYARTKNPKVIVVTGGPAIRALPRLAAPLFTYCCFGDVEQLVDVIVDAWGKSFASELMVPRYDLAYWIKWLGYVESTRNCNFRCSFCSLTGEDRKYQVYELDYIRQQIVAMGRRSHIVFIDNNFYGNDRASFHARVELIKEMRQAGYFQSWGALVTNDFFHNDNNLKIVRKAGCDLLFSGIESFDAQWLRSINKLQNVTLPQADVIMKCLAAGIVFCYGLILDVATRRLDDLRCEIDFINSTPEITLPNFISLSIPILDTPYFYECATHGRLLPDIKLRDMDGHTLVVEPLDPLQEVINFVRDIQTLRGHRLAILQHSYRFFKLYRSILSNKQMALALSNGAHTCIPFLTSGLKGMSRFLRKARTRTYMSTTEPLDDTYKPAFNVSSQYKNYFKPTMVTDRTGKLTENISSSGLAQPSSLIRLNNPETQFKTV